MWILFEVLDDAPGVWRDLCVSDDKAALEAECRRLLTVEYENWKSDAFSYSRYKYSLDQFIDARFGSFFVDEVKVWPEREKSQVIEDIKIRSPGIEIPID